MGFWRDLDRSIDQFLEFRPSAYKAEISGLSETELRALHKRIQRKIVGAGTQTGLGAIAAPATAGLSLIGSGIGARRLDVNTQRCDLIEARLREKGWTGHDFGFKDVIVGAGPGAVATILAPGADHVADHLINHVATSTAHHGTDQVLSHAATTAAHHGAHSASTAIGFSAAHHGTEAAIKLGTGYALDKTYGRPAVQKTSSSQTSSNHEAKKRPGDGSIKYQRSSSGTQTAVPAASQSGFMLAVTRFLMMLLPATMCSLLGQEYLWLASATTGLMAFASRDRSLMFFLISSLTAYYFGGHSVQWSVSIAAVVVDVLNRHSVEWHKKLLGYIKSLIYILVVMFGLIIGIYVAAVVGIIAIAVVSDFL